MQPVTLVPKNWQNKMNGAKGYNVFNEDIDRVAGSRKSSFTKRKAC